MILRADDVLNAYAIISISITSLFTSLQATEYCSATTLSETTAFNTWS